MDKLLVLDLDGTLLDNNSEISSYSKEILTSLIQKNIKVVLASGRPYQSMLPFAKELNLKTPLIANNGALIRNVSGGVLEQRSIKPKVARLILDYAQKNKLHISFYFPSKICIQELSNKADVHIKEEKVMPEVVGNLSRTLDQPLINILFNINQDLMKKTVKELKEKFGSSVSITQTTDCYIDIMGQNVNKGAGIKSLLKKYSLATEDVIAFGNNYNDLEMLKLAGLGVVTSNAPEEIKSQADMVTSSNHKDGVAKALEELF